MPHISVDVIGDETMPLLNRQKDAEEPSQINKRPDAQGDARREDEQSRVAQSIRIIEDQNPPAVENGNEQGTQEEANLQKKKREPLPADRAQSTIRPFALAPTGDKRHDEQ